MKTLRDSYDRETKQKPLTLVSAWASSHRLVLGQLKVNDKSNEITAISEPYVQVISQQLAEIQFLDTEA